MEPHCNELYDDADQKPIQEPKLQALCKKKKMRRSTHINEELKLTSDAEWTVGAPIKTTNGANSAHRRIFKACGSTSSIAMRPERKGKHG